MSTLDVRAVSERERQADLTRVFEQMETFHPEEPCWYLRAVVRAARIRGRRKHPGRLVADDVPMLRRPR
jgi:hypothetical protein